jgi:hypothetical protein
VSELPMADRHETVLPPASPDVQAELLEVRGLADPDERRDAIGRVLADHPTSLEGWAELSVLGREPIERYAYARVGYHRGLDALRANGWGGRGIVRWSREDNRPLLRCLAQLRATAAEIGEDPEVERLTSFLHELDPDWDDGNLTT